MNGGQSRERSKSRVGRAIEHEDGTASCRLQIPIGHPAATFHEPDGTPVEMEHELEFIAGPGITNLRVVDPVTRQETKVGGNLLEVSATNPEVHVGTSNLASVMRRAAKRFDAEVHAGRREAAGPTKETTAEEVATRTTSRIDAQASLL